MQRATTVWGTQGAVTGQRLGSQGVTIIDALTTGALQEFGTFQHRAVLAAASETPGRRPGTRSGGPNARCRVSVRSMFRDAEDHMSLWSRVPARET